MSKYTLKAVQATDLREGMLVLHSVLQDQRSISSDSLFGLGVSSFAKIQSIKVTEKCVHVGTAFEGNIDDTVGETVFGFTQLVLVAEPEPECEPECEHGRDAADPKLEQYFTPTRMTIMRHGLWSISDRPFDNGDVVIESDEEKNILCNSLVVFIPTDWDKNRGLLAYTFDHGDSWHLGCEHDIADAIKAKDKRC